MRTESWPALLPVSHPHPRPPPSLRPRYLANRSKRHTTHALMSTSHGEPSAESQRPQGPRQRVGWAPDTHTRWGDTPAPSCICTNTHTNTHSHWIGILSLTLFLSHIHTLSHLHPKLISHTRCSRTRWKLCTFRKEIFFSSVVGGWGWETCLHVTG